MSLEVSTDDLFTQALKLALDVIDSRAKLIDFMEVAAERIRTQENPYRVAAIMESTVRTVRVANQDQRDRLENMLATAQEFAKNGG